MNFSAKQMRAVDAGCGELEFAVRSTRHRFYHLRFVDPMARDIVDAAFSAPLPRGEKAAAKAREHALQLVLARAQRLSREARLNFLQRARLAIKVQNGLIEQGVSPDDSRRVAIALTQRLRPASAASAA